MSDTAIDVSGLRQRFGLTFTVSPGQITAFIGPNGAGKSTCPGRAPWWPRRAVELTSDAVEYRAEPAKGALR